MNKKIKFVSLCAMMAAQSTFAGTLPTDHAPIGVMGDHNHLQGEWMVAYRYNTMNMENMFADTGNILNGAMMAAKSMKREMHMAGMMYGATDQLTIVASVPYVKTSMDMTRAMGADFTTQASGVGDVKVGGLYTLFSEGHSKILANLAISLPTGSIDKTDDTPMMANQMLSPNMQPGSGTYDIIAKLTYTDRHDQWAWGSQIAGTVRTGRNDNGYKAGDRVALSGWVARNLADFVSISVRLDGQKWGFTTSDRPGVMPMMKGERIDILGGVNFIIPDGALKGNRFAIEFGKPIHQSITSSVMENDYRLHAGWQLAF